MKLKAGCEMTMVAKAPTPMIAMLRPRSGRAQWIQDESYRLEPRPMIAEYVDGFGNLCQRMTAPAGKLALRVEATVITSDEATMAPGAPLTEFDDLPVDALQYLLPSRYCPSDTLGERASGIVEGRRPGYDQVAAIEATIRSTIGYKYGVSDASTDASDTLREGAGVCRDFAHVGISLCRALTIPARMVVGYLYRLDPMDMHAWFEAYLNGRWYTFDATQREARGGRIVVAYGRDAADVAIITQYGPLETQDMNVWVERADEPERSV